jgi:hypothetical protein
MLSTSICQHTTEREEPAYNADNTKDVALLAAAPSTDVVTVAVVVAVSSVVLDANPIPGSRG